MALACIIGILLFVEIKSGRMLENVGLAIVVICYINIFVAIVSGVILVVGYVFKAVNFI